MKRKQIAHIHIAAWTVLFFSGLLLQYASHQDTQELQAPFKNLLIQVCYLLIPVSCFYGSYFFVAPQIFVHRHFILGICYAGLVLLGIILLRYLLEYHFFIPFLHFDNYGGHPWPLIDYAENIFFYYFPKYFVYGLLYFFVESWIKDKQVKQELQREKVSAELAFLRSQVNPHFLFNTINDIYSLAYRQSLRAPEALLKLSEVLRYMLREGADVVPLREEIQYLENVVALQRISAKGNAYINFGIEGYVGEHKVASLLFIAFVENAFKHGVLHDSRNPVSIQITAFHGNVRFHIQNKKNNFQKDSTSGIGLANVKRRLSMIYPGKHQLEINSEGEFYYLTLDLKTNI